MIHVCAADFGFRTDASAGVVIRADGSRFRLVDYAEQRPSRGSPLQPSVVIAHVAEMARRHGCAEVWCDYFYSETVREELAKHGLELTLGPAGQTGKVQVWTTARSLILEGRVSTPNLTALLAQLKLVRAKPLSGGGLSIEQPRRHGSHGDLAASFALALWAASQAVGHALPPGPLYTAASDPRHEAPRVSDRGARGSWLRSPFPPDDDEQDDAPARFQFL